MSDVSRVTRGLAIRRAKKRVNLTNDKRIKMWLQTFDRRAVSRLQFLRAVSHAVGSEKMLSESNSDADDDDDTEAPDDNTQHQNDDDTSDATPERQRPYQLTQLLTSARCVSWHRVIHASRWCLNCGHQRFCESCANEVHNQGRGCPLCHTPINMLLCLY